VGSGCCRAAGVGAGWWRWSSCGIAWWSSSRGTARLLSSCSVAWRSLCGVAWPQHCVVVVFVRRCGRMSSRGVAQVLSSHGVAQVLSSCSITSVWCSAVVVFAQRCMAVVSVRRRMVGVFVWRCIAQALSSRGVVQVSSSHSVAQCHLHAALCGGVFASPRGCHRTAVVFTCCRTAVVFTSLLLTGCFHLCRRGHCHCLVAEGQRHIPSSAPANGGGCAGAGVKGATATPLRDSGANPIRAQMGGRVQKGGGGGVGLACNKGAGGITYLPTLCKGGKREGPVHA
jgi:hypothetical protein